MKLLLMFYLFSCAAYTDPDRERLTYYKCDQKQIITTKHSADYASLMIRYNKDHNILLHHFVSLKGSGYRDERFLWITKEDQAVLVEKKADGSERILYNNCRTLK